jgi:hypothetical protein
MADKVAIVTAGGSGIGAGAARKLAADGFQVAILSSSGKGEALAREIGGIGVTGTNQSNDDLKRLVDAAMERWGRIDALVNSAGHGPHAPLLDLSDEDWHRGMEVYFLNVVRPTRLVTPVMQRQKSGAIVNVSTFATFEPDPDFRRFPRRARRLHEAVLGPLCRGKHPHEQRAAGLHRQPPGEGGVPEAHPNGTLRQGRGSRRADRAPGLRARRLHHRAEHPRRRRHHAIGVGTSIGSRKRLTGVPAKLLSTGPSTW